MCRTASDPADDGGADQPGSDATEPVATVRLTRRVAWQWLAGATAAFFVSAYVFAAVQAMVQGRPLEPFVIAATPTGINRVLVISLVLVALVVVLHELLHGVCMAVYGGETAYGVGVSYFVLPYAYAETDASFTRTQLLVTLLAPLVVITVGGLLALAVVPSSILIIPLAANVAGSVGDLWMAGTLLQYPANVRVSDPPGDVQGLSIYPPADGSASDSSTDAIDQRRGSVVLARVVTGAVGTLAGLIALGIVAVLGSLAVGSGDVIVGASEGRWLLFLHERHGSSASLEVGAPLALALATAGGLAWALVGTVREQLSTTEP
ncbi:DUF3267 domain-containing protein [Natronolimnobius baerhuensis]|uniref:DUF3267 domain-containing protein n=1 Tax=Natronolimnobius baerhuensis TaxID=253108 RepID=A0A202ECH1_9EURY|nr:DUF3267 domain-containing protein [Natronolimnobius baerhuensis]OVE85888.1 hypothetical protein B2G88_03510 [Natronolimnobius baerhuensis]